MRYLPLLEDPINSVCIGNFTLVLFLVFRPTCYSDNETTRKFSKLFKYSPFYNSTYIVRTSIYLILAEFTHLDNTNIQIISNSRKNALNVFTHIHTPIL